MRHISLQTIDLKHFKSFVSAHIDLNRPPGLRMVFGDNRCEPRLGANGAGKSTIFDAVEFCLSGRSIRGKRASELVTSGQKSTSVETAWLIDDELCRILRTYPSEKVYIDGELSNNQKVEELMGMSRERRLCSWLFGQSMPLFIDKPIPERGDLLDEVLQLSFWMRAADLATSKWNAANSELQKIQREISRLEGALEEVPLDADLQQAVEEYESERSDKVKELRDQSVVLNRELREIRRALAKVQVDVHLEEEANRRHTVLRDRMSEQLITVSILQHEIDDVDADIKFFEDTGRCPTCDQDIDKQLSDMHLMHLAEALVEKTNQLAVEQAALDMIVKEVGQASADIRALGVRTQDRHKLGLAEANKRGDISAVDNRIHVIQDQINPYEEQLQTVSNRRSELEDKLSSKRLEETSLSNSIDKLDFWRQGFRRVRVFCLRRVLAELEVATMSEARSLGLVGWHIKFSGETETRSGTTKLGVQAVVQSPSAKRDFDAFSPGEGQRIRCASALGLASLIQRYSGVSYDIEVWDEPHAWLSSEGIDDLFESLRERAFARNKSIWVIDPREGLLHGSFDEIWTVTKDGQGSHIDVSSGNLRN